MQSVMETQFRIWLETKRFNFILLTITVWFSSSASALEEN